MAQEGSDVVRIDFSVIGYDQIQIVQRLGFRIAIGTGKLILSNIRSLIISRILSDIRILKRSLFSWPDWNITLSGPQRPT